MKKKPKFQYEDRARRCGVCKREVDVVKLHGQGDALTSRHFARGGAGLCGGSLDGQVVP